MTNSRADMIFLLLLSFVSSLADFWDWGKEKAVSGWRGFFRKRNDHEPQGNHLSAGSALSLTSFWLFAGIFTIMVTRIENEVYHAD